MNLERSIQMETYLNDICDSELDIRNTPISDQKKAENIDLKQRNLRN